MQACPAAAMCFCVIPRGCHLNDVMGLLCVCVGLLIAMCVIPRGCHLNDTLGFVSICCDVDVAFVADLFFSFLVKSVFWSVDAPPL